MLNQGLVSVTFRKHTVAEVADIAKKAGLDCIEWGGDIHVPPNDSEAVSNAKNASRDAEIKIVSYGSYYNCLGSDEDTTLQVKTAAALGAPNIRIWAGKLWSSDCDDSARAEVVHGIKNVCKYAADYGMTVSPEFHGGTLTDTIESALRLYDEVAEENFRLYWQPNQFEDDEYNIRALRSVLPYLSNVHVFSWKGSDMFPLANGEKMWLKYIDMIRSDGHDHNLLLEFVCDGSPDQLYRDAETLHKWLR